MIDYLIEWASAWTISLSSTDSTTLMGETYTIPLVCFFSILPFPDPRVMRRRQSNTNDLIRTCYTFGLDSISRLLLHHLIKQNYFGGRPPWSASSHPFWDKMLMFLRRVIRPTLPWEHPQDQAHPILVLSDGRWWPGIPGRTSSRVIIKIIFL